MFHRRIEIERPAIMLPARVVALGEVLEAHHFSHNRGLSVKDWCRNKLMMKLLGWIRKVGRDIVLQGQLLHIKSHKPHSDKSD